jgi:MurNAc alpha-1-phosphate uridylyltransferase
MRALLLAAGRGERLRPLTDTLAKPLIEVAGRRLIEWQISALVRAGICDLVINTAHLAEQIEATLGDGSRYGARIQYSREGTRAEDALETLGGIVQALPLLGPEPFVLVSSDIVTDFDYRTLQEPAAAVAHGQFDAHLILVENPPFHPEGDMGALPDPAVRRDSGGVPDPAQGPAQIPPQDPQQDPPQRSLACPNSGPVDEHAQQPTLLATRANTQYTYANIGVLAPRLFAGLAPVRARLFPWLYAAVARGRVSAQLYRGRWWNVGTPQELQNVNENQ